MSSLFDDRRAILLIALAVPGVLFVISLFVPPAMFADSGAGFLVLRSMFGGAGFNTFFTPDAADIARDVGVFQTWWSPGQYLAPGFFIWLGMNYGLAISLTALIATIAGVLGWARLAQIFQVPKQVLVLFLLGLVCFRYATVPFRIYNGGELLLFACAPWSLVGLLWALEKNFLVALLVSFAAAALLFFAKLTGLIVFAANVVAISAYHLIERKRPSGALIGIWAGALCAVLCYLWLWQSRGSVPAGGGGFSPAAIDVAFPIAATIVSGISAFDFLNWVLLNPARPVLDNLDVVTFVIAMFGLAIMAWTWTRLRKTQRPMAQLFFGIAAIYALAFILLYARDAAVSMEERHFRYAGILIFLLLLTASHQSRSAAVKLATLVVVVAGASYGLVSYIAGTRAAALADTYEPLSGTTQLIASPAALSVLRQQIATDGARRPLVVVPTPEAALALPGVRILALMIDFMPIEAIKSAHWRGHAERIYVLVQGSMVDNGKAEALLKSFADYDYGSWQKSSSGGMVIFSQ